MTTVQTKPRRTAAGVLGDVLLWLAAVGGAVCILVVIAAVGFQVTLIMFKTGSMEPTIPTGALAVVHEVPADQIAVGDIVTVDRPGQLPVTHRVTSIAGTGDTRTITLRGDANEMDDAAPYVVDSVRVVWWWIPGWAQVIVWFSHPVVLGTLTLGATGLVTWAFWPREAGHGRRRASRRPRGRSVVTGSAGALLMCAALVLAPAAPPAQAADVETVTTSTYLELTSISDPDLISSMTPGAPVPWQVGVDAFPPDPGLVHIGIAATGPMISPGDMSISIRACAVRWVSGVCSTGASTWLTTTDLAAAVSPATAFGAREVGTMDAFSQRWLMMNVTLTASGMPPGSWGALRLQAWGVGGALSTGLASTGPAEGSITLPLLLAGGAIGAGLLAAGVAARRRREADDG
ncbi:MAG: signal peptidase I [Rhodoglobus sp.]